jgi:hypothetical protein
MCNGLHHYVPLVEWSKNIYETFNLEFDERVMPPRKCINYRYYRSEITGTTGPRRFGADMNYRYYRSETGTADGWRKEAQFGVNMNCRYYR